MPADSPDPVAAVMPAVTKDHGLPRFPMVRQAWTLVMTDPQHPNRPARITVRETSTGGRLIYQEPGSVLEHEGVHLTVQELRQLAAHCQRIAGRVARRPKGRP